jgi:hypothetical protein
MERKRVPCCQVIKSISSYESLLTTSRIFKSDPLKEGLSIPYQDVFTAIIRPFPH